MNQKTRKVIAIVIIVMLVLSSITAFIGSALTL